jgi:hypothetical protein
MSPVLAFVGGALSVAVGFAICATVMAPAKPRAAAAGRTMLLTTYVALPPTPPQPVQPLDAYPSERACLVARAALEAQSNQWRSGALTGICLPAGAHP